MAHDFDRKQFTSNSDSLGTTMEGDTIPQESETMIDWRKFSDMLSQSIKDGVRYSMVMKHDGSLLACAGAHPLPKDFKRIVPPLVVSMWKCTQDVGKKFVNAIGLDFMFFNCKVQIVFFFVGASKKKKLHIFFLLLYWKMGFSKKLLFESLKKKVKTYSFEDEEEEEENDQDDPNYPDRDDNEQVEDNGTEDKQGDDNYKYSENTNLSIEQD
ncbi:hypothetical protein RFI_09982 [Reticulomyxa filosa]|uniref:Uncharacterized protein n=1 Tax=Reticulomyxa filosa TaxID=46433 RepID=X6NLI8_RETFI|nr:hypothetical protein RFI_09982 [Reticulomyxa filosa]|eukprot:ETO27150.1 hypothetical protein RFI_09982 [Reticulomyxa filosa]